ncbi:protein STRICTOSIDINE SYNTHASE-LIKE 10-like [Magnolia sinica]|uniref:protein STRICTOSIDINE SYNTHASE-LIKE 10-like n=1 Tax=Magnolia sinica TaxID=86752 RepID=UPI00265941E7|nr:protein STRICTOSIDINE SYNTHASE-LIKE 10-like [Magnolia sinica]
MTMLAIFFIFVFFCFPSLSLSLPLVITIEPGRFQQLDLGGLAGPESIVFDPMGNGPYTGVSDGRVLKWQGAARGWTEFAVTSPRRNEECNGHKNPWLEDMCGRPLGLQFSKATGDLYIADAYHGLFVVGPTGGLATQLASGAQGVPFHFTNGLDIDQATGIVYFTDSSMIYTRRDNTLVTISGDRTGRLLKYDPRSKKVTVLLKGLVYPNGVAISKDSTFLLIVETSTQRILRFWLQGSTAGAPLEVFAQLSGYPDNIKRNPRGEFWVAVASINGVIGISFNENGEITKVLNDKFGKITSRLSEVGENNGSLWLGSVVAPDVGIYKL